MTHFTDQGEIVLITDYGLRDPNSLTQLRRRMGRHFPQARIIEAPVEPRSTINASFWTYVHGVEENRHPNGTLLYVNCAPRGNGGAPCPGNNQEPLVYAELDNGVIVLAMAAGHTLTLVRPHIRVLHEVIYDHGNSQWRSLKGGMPDAARAIATDVLSHNKSALPRLGRKLDVTDVNLIPPLRDGVWVLHVCGDFGNIKTSLRLDDASDLRHGTRVAVRRANNVPGPTQGEPLTVPPTQTCEYRPGIFEVPVGQWVIAPGSNGGPNPFLEVAKRLPPDTHEPGAAPLLGVKVGDQLLIEPLGQPEEIVGT